jgi:hypothetical protein
MCIGGIGLAGALTLTPSAGTVAGSITLQGLAVGFLTVEVSYNDMLFGRATPAADGAFAITFSTLSLPDGPDTLAVAAYNAAAGQPYTLTAAAAWSVTVGNSAINIESHGAVADGTTDNITAITNAIAAAATAGVSVYVPAGTFAFGNIISLTGTKMFGVGVASVLYALDYNNEAIFLYGSGSQVRQLTLTGATAPARLSPWQATHITAFGASNFVIDHVNIVGSAAAGIQLANVQVTNGAGSSNGMITNNTLTGTFADSIHMTAWASFIHVEGNTIVGSGDDGIAVVSYDYDSGVTHDITAINNVITGNVNGRSMSVVGGENVLYQNNYLANDTLAAGVYIAQESSYNTYGCTNVTVEFNTIVNCGNYTIGHAPVMIITTGSGSNTDINLISNQIVITTNNYYGVRVYGNNTPPIVLNYNQIIGTPSPYDIEDTGVTLNPYVSGAVGYVAAPVLPIP